MLNYAVYIGPRAGFKTIPVATDEYNRVSLAEVLQVMTKNGLKGELGKQFFSIFGAGNFLMAYDKDNFLNSRFPVNRAATNLWRDNSRMLMEFHGPIALFLVDRGNILGLSWEDAGFLLSKWEKYNQ